MHNFLLIIQREFLTKVKSKSYLVLLFLSPILMLFLFGAVFYFANKDHQEKTQETPVIYYTGHKAELRFNGFKTIYIENIHNSLIHQILSNQQAQAIIQIKYPQPNIKVYSIGDFNIQKIQLPLQNLWTKNVLKQNHIAPTIIAKSQQKVSFEHLQPIKENATINAWVKKTIAIGSGYLVMMFVIIYGNSVMRSIIEEKNSRVIEIMICTVKPFELMIGKILGNALAGILQFVTWGTLLLGGLLLFENSGMQSTTDINDFNLIMDAIWQINYIEVFTGFILFFTFGYLLYSGIYAAVGAASNSETDTQQFVHPILLPLMFAVYIGIVTVANNSTHEATAQMFSLIPFTAPVVMLMRIPFGVPVTELMLSLIILIATFILMVYIASKIYRIGILTYGTKPSVKQLIKWLKY